MILLQSIQDFQSLNPEPHGKPRVLVPTMGALHLGHCSLIAQAREVAGSEGSVIVSIFVNPTQFDRPEDLECYPSTLEADLELCKEYGADYVFAPQANEMYFPDASISLTEKSLSARLCGRTRPGHFDGVCLVVNKLFNITRATHAIFGEKDFQQLAIIKRMVKDLNMNVEVIGGATVREDSGLAMSSRNLNLSKEHAEQAPAIRQEFLKAQDHFSSGEATPEALIDSVRHSLKSLPCEPRIDYLEIVDTDGLQPVTTKEELYEKPSAMAIAIFFGEVRLIDHIHFH